MITEKRSVKRVQITITIVASVILIVHHIFPSLNFDEISLILLIIAIIPWVIPIFKTIEFPGGWKVEFQDYEEIEKKAKEQANKAIKSDDRINIQNIKWNNAATLFWLGNDLMWIKDMTYRGAHPSKVLKGIENAIKYSEKLGFTEDSLPIKNLEIAKHFITPLIESESSDKLDSSMLTNYYFNIQEYIEPVKWYISSLAEKQEPGFIKHR